MKAIARSLFVAGAILSSLPAGAQTSGAQIQREQKPSYPEGLAQASRQGNVILIGRIDTHGKVQDIQPLATSNVGFLDPSIAAVKAWQFKPAMRNGKPIDVAANIGVRFRLQSKNRDEIPRPVLGDLSIFPADASGHKTAPEGFPVRRGGDPRIRFEAVLDLPPSESPQRIAVHAETLSPKGRRIALWDGSVPVAAKTAQVPIPFTAAVGRDWEDGVWTVALSVADAPAGGGVFWLAADPEHFDFAAEMAKKAASSLAPTPAAPEGGTARPRPTPTRRRK
jgi:TonB family protein